MGDTVIVVFMEKGNKKMPKEEYYVRGNLEDIGFLMKKMSANITRGE